MANILDKSTRILIVDDNTMYVQVLSKMLKNALGYEIITAVDSIEKGYRELKSNPNGFDLLFVDFRFPSGETGADLLRRLQQEHLLVEKIVFLITSEPSVDNVKEAKDAGAVGVVAKPFDREELKKQLERASRFFSEPQDSF